MASKDQISIYHLQSRLARLLEEVRTHCREPQSLSAEVLLSMNELCAPGMLLGIWRTMEKVGPREEILLVRLLREMESDRLDQACNALITSTDSETRSVGYAIIALRSRRAGADEITTAFHREPGIVLKRSGRRQLAPHSFITCMLAGIRDFKDDSLDREAMRSLSRFAGGQSDLDCIAALLAESRASVAQLGFAALASRFMGILHHLSYNSVAIHEDAPVNERAANWLLKGIQLAPEVIEAVVQAGPDGVADARFMRARMRVLRRFAGPLEDHIHALIEGKVLLPSVRIEQSLSPERRVNYTDRNSIRALSIGYQLALILNVRSAIQIFVDGLRHGGTVETAVLERFVDLCGEGGALNMTGALLSFWDQLDETIPGEAGFKGWIERRFEDRRQPDLGVAVDRALARPDEDSLYAARVLSVLGDRVGALVRRLYAGDPIDLGEIGPCLADERFGRAVRCILRDPDAGVHPTTILTLARAGIHRLVPSLRAMSRHGGDDAHVHALKSATQLMVAHELAQADKLFGQLAQIGLADRDRDLESSRRALRRLPAGHPARDLIAEAPEDRALYRVYYFFEDMALPNPVGPRIASGFVARAEFVIDFELRAVLHAAYYDRTDRGRTAFIAQMPPEEYFDGFMEIPWMTLKEDLRPLLEKSGGKWLSVVRSIHAERNVRILAEVDNRLLRLSTNDVGQFDGVLMPLDFKRVDAAISALEMRYGDPTFRSDSAAVWHFDQVSITVKPDPAFDTLTEYVRYAPTD